MTLARGVALCLVLCSLLTAPAARAEDDAEAARAARPSRVRALVQRTVVNFLGRREGRASIFSREARPTLERRVRLLDDEPRTDADGQAFFRYVIEQRQGLEPEDGWRESGFHGCAYPASQQVHVDVAGRLRPATVLGATSSEERARTSPARACRPAGGGAAT